MSSRQLTERPPEVEKLVHEFVRMKERGADEREMAEWRRRARNDYGPRILDRVREELAS